MQGMALGNKVVLPADPAQHPAVFELISHGGTEQGHGECAVDEARITPLQAFQLFLAV